MRCDDSAGMSQRGLGEGTSLFEELWPAIQGEQAALSLWGLWAAMEHFHSEAQVGERTFFACLPPSCSIQEETRSPERGSHLPQVTQQDSCQLPEPRAGPAQGGPEARTGEETEPRLAGSRAQTRKSPGSGCLPGTWISSKHPWMSSHWAVRQGRVGWHTQLHLPRGQRKPHGQG